MVNGRTTYESKKATVYTDRASIYFFWLFSTLTIARTFSLPGSETFLGENVLRIKFKRSEMLRYVKLYTCPQNILRPLGGSTLNSIRTAPIVLQKRLWRSRFCHLRTRIKSFSKWPSRDEWFRSYCRWFRYEFLFALISFNVFQKQNNKSIYLGNTLLNKLLLWTY